MDSREKYFNIISSLIENNTTDPIQILNNLYQTDFNSSKKRKHSSLFQPASTLNSLDLTFLKFSEALTVKNKSAMVEALCAFTTFFPHLSLHIPAELKNDVKPYALSGIIKSKLPDDDIEKLALKGKIQDLQDLVSLSSDKGLLLVNQLCQEIRICFITIKRCHDTLSGCVTSLGDLGDVISSLPMAVQVKVLKVLFQSLYIVPSATTALVKLIPQLYLPKEINKISNKIQKTFKKNKKDDWIRAAKVLNIIDMHYPLSAIKRHKIIKFLLSNMEKRPEAYEALANLSDSIGMGCDGGMEVIESLRQTLKANSYVTRASAVKVLNKLTTIILKMPESNSLLLEFAQYVVTIPEYYKFSWWPRELEHWELIIASQADRGEAFFKVLTDAALLNVNENSTIILHHIIFWKHLLKQLPEKGYGVVLAYLRALEQQKEKFRFDRSHPPGAVCILINLAKDLKEILTNFPNELLLILREFTFFWHTVFQVSYCRYDILKIIDELSDLISNIGEKAYSILKPMEQELKDFQTKKLQRFHIPLNENKKQFLDDNCFIIDWWLAKDVANLLVGTYFQLYCQYPQQASWVWTVLDFFNTYKKSRNIDGVTQAIGKFYTISSQQALLFSHIPIKDVTHIVQEYTYSPMP